MALVMMVNGARAPKFGRLCASLLLLGLLLSACAGGERPPTKPGGAGGGGASGGLYKIGEPYQINGIWYYPNEDYSYDETGVASWYGPDFDGKYTANGEIYDMNALTAAHRTLPMPSMAQVTNLDNGRSLVLRINDRGPYARGRILDVSRYGAQLLGFDNAGTARVRVTILADASRQIATEMKTAGLYQRKASGPPPIEGKILASANAPIPVRPVTVAPPPLETPLEAPPETPPKTLPAAQKGAKPPGVLKLPSTTPAKGWDLYVQVAAFSNRAAAGRLSDQLRRLGPSLVTPTQIINHKPLYRVRVGPFKSTREGDLMLDKIINAGHLDAKLVVDR